MASSGCARLGLAGRHEARVFTLPPPSATERYCAWYGDSAGSVLHLGSAPFWAAFRASGGDPGADAHTSGPERIERFDLQRRAWLAPLRVGEEGPSGVWDVLVHPSGRIWFTTFFGPAGFVDPATGAVERLDTLGPGLNELALGPDASILATRYGRDLGGDGSVVWLAADGGFLAELVLEPGADGEVAAAKSVAFDPLRREIWVNTDLLPGDGGATGHDARVLDLAGRELQRVAEPEIQFTAFAADGAAWIAAAYGRRLVLYVRPAGSAQDPFAGRVVDLDLAFPHEVDFVQDIKPMAGPRGEPLAVVTRWSGRVHVADLAGRVRSVALPALAEGGLYYTAVLHEGRVCATYCHDTTVVCERLPAY